MPVSQILFCVRESLSRNELTICITSMDSKKGKKEGRKIAAEVNSSRVKRLINDITEIKRPPGKQKTSVDCNVADKYRIFHKNNTKMDRYFQNEYKFKTTNTNIKSEHKNDESPLSSLNKKCDEIERKVQEFGENLRKKREELHHHEVNIYATSSETTTYAYNLCHFELDVTPKKENVTCQNIEENEQCKMLKNEESEEMINYSGAVKNKNTMDSKEEIQESEEEEKTLSQKSTNQTEDDDNVFESEGSIDDLFGFNDFDENQSDNYIIETYNRDGGEVFVITLQITRRTVLQNDNVNFQNNDDFDYIFHQKEYYSDNSTDEDVSGSSDCNYQHVIRVNCETDDQSLGSSTDSTVSLETNNNYVNHFTQRNSNFFENNSESGHSTGSGEEDNFYHFSHNLASESDVTDYVDIQTTNKTSEREERINYVIQEIIQSEKQYISVLEKVVEKYIPYIEAHTPQGLIGKTTYLFGNFVQIYENAKEFLRSLENSSRDPDGIACVFINSASEFELYPLYSKNKPTADIYLKHFEDVVRKRQNYLNDKLGLASHLLTPIQRLGKYVLLLEQIKKELDKMTKPSEDISEAMEMIKKVMKRGNDYIAIDSIKHCGIDLTLYGSFIMRSCFNILKPKKFISMVFLFEQVIVFTEKITKTAEQFKYVDCIQMSDLSLGKFEEKLTIFHLTNYTKAKKSSSDATFVLEAESPRMKNDWTAAIEKKLWSQLERAKEEQKYLGMTDYQHGPKASTMPRYSKRDSKKLKLNRSKSKSKSRFYGTDGI